MDISIQDIYGKCITLIRRAKYKNQRIHLPRNMELKLEDNNNKRCYVIGLGPSLKNVNYSRINGDSIVVNRFHAYDKGAFFPTYYMLSDGAYYQEPLLSELKSMYEMYPNTKFILDGLYAKEIKTVLTDDSRVYYTYSGNGVYSHKKEIDYSKWVPVKYNVVAGAIALCIFMGYKEIILVGCDFNSFAYPKAIHCYDEEDDSRKISLSFELFCYSFAAYIHEELEKYARRNNIHIINATENSLIDAYERSNIEQFLID